MKINRFIFILIVSYHIPENFFGLSILAGILFIVLVLIFEDRIIVYKDRFVFSRNFFFNIINVNKTFYYKNIKFIDTENNTLTDDVFSLLANYKYGLWNHIWITFLNNDRKILNIWMDRPELNDVILIIKKYIPKIEEIKIDL